MCSGNHCCCLIYSFPENTAVLTHYRGKHDKILRPGSGLVCINCITRGVSMQMSLKLRTLKVRVETKTKDHTFMNLAIDVQYRTKPDDESIYRAAFNLSDPEAQMTAYVEDVVRSAVNKLTLNEVYREKTAISDKVKNQLEQIMKDFGYEIVSAPIVDLAPADHAVLNEMNRVLELEKQWGAQANVNAQLKQRIVFSAEAEKVKSIESGKGVADKRRAIVDGLRESVSTFKDGVQGVSAKDVLELILMTQYFDMLKDVGSRGSSTLFLKHGPGAVTDITADIKTGFETANQMIGK